MAHVPMPSDSRGASVRSELPAGQTLHSGDSLVSRGREYTFVNQEDGNLCIYNQHGQPTWASGTWRRARGDVILLTDGNLVFFDTEGTGKPAWATMSQGITKAAGPYTLVMQDDGNLVVYGTNGIPTWASQSDKSSGLFSSSAGKAEMRSDVTWLRVSEKLVSSNGRYTFVNQEDGNLCIYRNGEAIWASGTYKKGAGNLYMQRDGNLVFYNTNGSGAPVWSSDTFGKGTGPYTLVMQDDANLVIYDAKSTPIWASNTA